jgi:hypothetical protein
MGSVDKPLPAAVIGRTTRRVFRRPRPRLDSSKLTVAPLGIITAAKVVTTKMMLWSAL